jgi:hypothetical protein
MMITPQGNGGWISSPKPQDAFERSSQNEAHDHVARPMRQHDDPGQRQRDRDGSDDPAGLRRQSSGSGSERPHVQRVARGKGILPLARNRNATDMPSTSSGRVWSNNVFMT